MMSGGMPGGAGDGGRGCQWRASVRFQERRVSRDCPGHPRVKMKIDIVTRENKILTHGLNEKNPTINPPFQY